MKSPSLLRYSVLAALVASSAWSQADDPGGLWNAKWNMTLSEVRTAVPGVAAVDPPVRNFSTVSRLKTSGSINGFRMDVMYEFNPQVDQLCAATITPGPGIDRRTAFYALKQGLVERYGKPTDEDTTEQSAYFEKVVLWSLPATTIRLDWLEMGSVSNVSVRYSARGMVDLPM